MAKFDLDTLLNLEGNKIPTDAKSYSTFIYGSPKSGKALDNETVIPTPNGKVKVKDVKEGDFLFDRMGRPTKVTGVFPQGTLKAFEVFLNDGTSFIVNDEHIIPYVTSRNNFKSKTLKEMMEDYKTYSEKFGRTVPNHKYRVPKNDAVEYQEKEYNIHPYALGVLIGDGALTCKYLTVSSSEIDVVERFLEKAELTAYNKSKWNYNFLFQKQHNGLRPKEIQSEIERLGLNVKSIDRFIPEEYLMGSVEQRKELLAGLIDTDGTITVNPSGSRRYGFSTNSKKLIDSIRELVLSLGYGATLQSKDRNDDHHKNTEYLLSIFTTDVLAKSNKHLTKLHSRDDWYESTKERYSKIIDIKEVEEREMTCFTVDNEEKLFLINDFIVTHNTSFINNLYGEKVLFIATENRHDAIANAHVIKIDSWAEFLKLMKLLKKPELQEKYDAIVIDTVTRLESYCEQYVLAKLQVDDLSDADWGKGFGEYNKELERGLTLIEKSGFVPHFIAHSKTETKKVLVTQASAEEKGKQGASVVKDKKDGKEYIEYQKVVPDVKNKFFNMINRQADNILYLDKTVDSNGHETRRLFYRDSVDHLAGASYKHMVEFTDATPEAYSQAVVEAIQKEGSDNIIEGSRSKNEQSSREYDFDSLMKEVATLGKGLKEQGRDKELSQAVEEVLGKGKKVNTLTESQAELLAALVDRLKEIS